MIKAIIFDLDGTLVQTEKLKALSYARAAVELCPRDLNEEAVIEAFKEVVGLSRREVATFLVERFELTRKSRERMAEFGVNRPWQAYVQVRLVYYREMISDPETLRQNQWPHSIKLLRQAEQSQCKVALATMSRCDQAQRVLDALKLRTAFDFIATRDDVSKGKPDPEIYQLAALELGISPENCLVIEDSPSGVRAALAADMQVVALATPFTKEKLQVLDRPPEVTLVDDPADLAVIVTEIIGAGNS